MALLPQNPRDQKLLVLGMLVVGLYVTDVLRYKALARATSVHITWRAGLDASVANFVFSNITPGSTFGVPATRVSSITVPGPKFPRMIA